MTQPLSDQHITASGGRGLLTMTTPDGQEITLWAMLVSDGRVFVGDRIWNPRGGDELGDWLTECELTGPGAFDSIAAALDWAEGLRDDDCTCKWRGAWDHDDDCRNSEAQVDAKAQRDGASMRRHVAKQQSRLQASSARRAAVATALAADPDAEGRLAAATSAITEAGGHVNPDDLAAVLLGVYPELPAARRDAVTRWLTAIGEDAQELQALGEQARLAQDRRDDAFATLRSATLAAIAGGMSEQRAAKLAGVNRMTVRRWQGKG